MIVIAVLKATQQTEENKTQKKDQKKIIDKTKKETKKEKTNQKTEKKQQNRIKKNYIFQESTDEIAQKDEIANNKCLMQIYKLKNAYNFLIKPIKNSKHIDQQYQGLNTIESITKYIGDIEIQEEYKVQYFQETINLFVSTFTENGLIFKGIYDDCKQYLCILLPSLFLTVSYFFFWGAKSFVKISNEEMLKLHNIIDSENGKMLSALCLVLNIKSIFIILGKIVTIYAEQNTPLRNQQKKKNITKIFYKIFDSYYRVLECYKDLIKKIKYEKNKNLIDIIEIVKVLYDEFFQYEAVEKNTKKLTELIYYLKLLINIAIKTLKNLNILKEQNIIEIEKHFNAFITKSITEIRESQPAENTRIYEKNTAETEKYFNEYIKQSTDNIDESKPSTNIKILQMIQNIGKETNNQQIEKEQQNSEFQKLSTIDKIEKPSNK